MLDISSGPLFLQKQIGQPQRLSLRRNVIHFNDLGTV